MLRYMFGKYGRVLDVSIRKLLLDHVNAVYTYTKSLYLPNHLCSQKHQSGYGFVYYSSSPEGTLSALNAVKAYADFESNGIRYQCHVSHRLDQLLDANKLKSVPVDASASIAAPVTSKPKTANEVAGASLSGSSQESSAAPLTSMNGQNGVVDRFATMSLNEDGSRNSQSKPSSYPSQRQDSLQPFASSEPVFGGTGAPQRPLQIPSYGNQQTPSYLSQQQEQQSTRRQSAYSTDPTLTQPVQNENRSLYGRQAPAPVRTFPGGYARNQQRGEDSFQGTIAQQNGYAPAPITEYQTPSEPYGNYKPAGSSLATFALNGLGRGSQDVNGHGTYYDQSNGQQSHAGEARNARVMGTRDVRPSFAVRPPPRRGKEQHMMDPMVPQTMNGGEGNLMGGGGGNVQPMMAYNEDSSMQYISTMGPLNLMGPPLMSQPNQQQILSQHSPMQFMYTQPFNPNATLNLFPSPLASSRTLNMNPMNMNMNMNMQQNVFDPASFLYLSSPQIYTPSPLSSPAISIPSFPSPLIPSGLLGHHHLMQGGQYTIFNNDFDLHYSPMVAQRPFGDASYGANVGHGDFAYRTLMRAKGHPASFQRQHGQPTHPSSASAVTQRTTEEAVSASRSMTALNSDSVAATATATAATATATMGPETCGSVVEEGEEPVQSSAPSRGGGGGGGSEDSHVDSGPSVESSDARELADTPVKPTRHHTKLPTSKPPSRREAAKKAMISMSAHATNPPIDHF